MLEKIDRFLPGNGQGTCTKAPSAIRRSVPDQLPPDLVRYLATSTDLPPSTAVRVIADVIAYFSETTEEFVRRRHSELQRRQQRNDEIWPVIAAELGQRRFAAPGLSERQLRRIVYG